MVTLTPQEFASQMMISPRMLNELADEKRLATVKRSLTHSLADFLLVNGAKVTEVETHIETSDPSMRGAIEMDVVGEHIPDLTLLALVAKQERRQDKLVDALLSVNSVSWWRFLWLKLRGRDLVTFS